MRPASETWGDKVTGTLSNCEVCHGEFKSGAVSTKGSLFGGGTKHDMHADMTLDRVAGVVATRMRATAERKKSPAGSWIRQSTVLMLRLPWT